MLILLGINFISGTSLRLFGSTIVDIPPCLLTLRIRIPWLDKCGLLVLVLLGDAAEC